VQQVTTMRNKWREDFSGSNLGPNWHIAQTGSGHGISVSSSELRITTGTTVNTETILRSVPTFFIPFRVWFIFMLSQRIANQEFFLEVTNSVGTMMAQWRFDGTSATNGLFNATNAGTSGSWISQPIPTTASMAIAELDLYSDEAYFNSRSVDSLAVRWGSTVRTRFIPDPNDLYFVQIRARNLAVAPASSTTLTVDAVSVQDITEISAEIIGGRGGTGANQALGINVVGGTLPFVATLTTGHVQAIQTQYIDSVTALGAGATFTGTTRDFSTTPRRNRFEARAFADQAGTLFIEQSRDGTTFRSPVGHSVALAAGETRQLSVNVVTRYARVRYVNGGTAQGSFELLSAELGI